MTVPTLSAVLARVDLTPTDEALADIEVPVLTGPQRQGDILIVPRPAAGAAERFGMSAVPAHGVQVVRGEATGNTHMLHPEPGHVCWWQPMSPTGRRSGLTFGVLYVPEDAVCWLIHTEEHGANGIGPGTYTLLGKREKRDEIVRVSD